MLQQIMNMLWNSRRHNLWIMLELVVITIVSWAVLDPVVCLDIQPVHPERLRC
mgnify:CR=1 FL=1